MKKDPTIELLQAMAADDLSPKGIIWNGRFQRFPGVGQKRGDSGFYRAFVDQRGAVCGDSRTGLRRKWKLTGVPSLTAEEKADIGRRREEAEREAREVAAEAQAAVDRLWKLGEPCSSHPYLEAKGFTDPIKETLRWVPDEDTDEPVLLIPMYAVIGAQLGNVQRIWPDGTRLQMPNVRKTGLFNTIGGTRFAETGLIYVCEGWATGYSIHLATNGTVAVAFDINELESVAKVLRKKCPWAKLLICGDNDRWSPVWRDTKMVPNPGVTVAREAAKAADAEICIPDFEDLSDVEPIVTGLKSPHWPPPASWMARPADFDDLRRREGLEAVRRWLDPNMARHAVTTLPEPEEAELETELEGDKEPHWTESFASRCLGMEGTTHHFFPRRAGEVLSLSQRQMTPKNLLALDRLAWYAESFPMLGRRGGATGKPDWNKVVDELVAHSQSLGPYRPDKLCGRGYHRVDDSRLLVHLGTKLLAPGKRRYVDPVQYAGDRIYVKQPPLQGPGRSSPLPVGKCRQILTLFDDLLWAHSTSGRLLAGWVTLAPVCGYLRWRPHVWITGKAECGKTTVLNEIVVPLTAGMSLRLDGTQTTEAEIRQGLGPDVLPVILDFERDKRAAQRVKGILRMMRSSSSSIAEASRIGATGRSHKWQPRSMFCLGSVGGRVSETADKHPRAETPSAHRPRRGWRGRVGIEPTHPVFSRAHWF